MEFRLCRRVCLALRKTLEMPVGEPEVPTPKALPEVRVLAFVILLLLAPLPAIGAGLKLVYDVTETETQLPKTTVHSPGDASHVASKRSKDSPSVNERRSEITVVLWASCLSIRKGTSETLYDFGARRTHRLDHAAGTTRHTSLYADIGFREEEVRHGGLKMTSSFFQQHWCRCFRKESKE